MDWEIARGRRSINLGWGGKKNKKRRALAACRKTKKKAGKKFENVAKARRSFEKSGKR